MPDADAAYAFCQHLALPKAVYKVGLELLFTGGIDLVRRLAADGFSVFVDAKLFDIGNTVERATAQLASLGATFLRYTHRTSRRSKPLTVGAKDRT